RTCPCGLTALRCRRCAPSWASDLLAAWMIIPAHRQCPEEDLMLLVRLALALALSAVLAPPVLAQEPVRVGVLTIRSGPIASCGRQMEDGLQFALKERGNTLGGRKVEVFFGDVGR